MTHPEGMRDWKYLGRALREARGRLSRADVARLSGVSAAQIKRYEAGLLTPVVIPDKLWVLAAFYGWTPDSINEVLAGGRPKRADASEPQPPGPLPPDLMDQVLTVVGESKVMTSGDKRRFLRWLLEHGE